MVQKQPDTQPSRTHADPFWTDTSLRALPHQAPLNAHLPHWTKNCSFFCFPGLLSIEAAGWHLINPDERANQHEKTQPGVDALQKTRCRGGPIDSPLITLWHTVIPKTHTQPATPEPCGRLTSKTHWADMVPL